EEEGNPAAGLVADAAALLLVAGAGQQQGSGTAVGRPDHHPALVALVDVFQQREAELAGVPGDGFVVIGHHQGGQGDTPAHADSAACCAASSSVTPFSARPSRASSSSRRKAWPSAVPC